LAALARLVFAGFVFAGLDFFFCGMSG